MKVEIINNPTPAPPIIRYNVNPLIENDELEFENKTRDGVSISYFLIT